MWRFIDTVTPPPQKKQRTDDEKRGKKRQYDNETRQRKWQERWKRTDTGEEREWLVYDDTKQEMHCAVCRTHATGDRARKSTFVVGSTKFKLESIKEHECSTVHAASCQIAAARTNPEKTDGARLISSLTKQQAEKMELLFRSAHAIAKKARPFSDFEWMCELDRKKGTNVGKTYTTRHQAKNFVGFIASAERERVLDEMRKSKFLSLMSDGSTDSAIVEEEIVYVRWCSKGVPTVTFVGLAAVQKADASHIFDGIESLMTSTCASTCEKLEKLDWGEKLVAFGSDGAAVMTGKNNGVVAKIKSAHGAHIIGIHCMAHRLELSFKDALQQNTCHRQLDDLLLGLYYFYHKSPLNRANLKKSYDALGMKPIMPTRVGGTRWVGHIRTALDHFLRGYPAIVQHLEQIQSPDAQGVRPEQQAKSRKFYKVATSFEVIQYACFLLDVLQQLNNLSLTLQRKTITIAEVAKSLQVTRAVIEKYKDRDGSMLQKLNKKPELEGVPLTKSGNSTSFQASRRKLLDGLLASLDRRFDDVDAGLLKSSAIVDFSVWPHKDSSKDFGDDCLDDLTEHFKAVLESAHVDTTQVTDEWTSLKTTIYNHPDWQTTLKDITWAEVNRRWGKGHDNILAVVDMVLTFPASTAECERGFNVMKMIKSDWRSALNNTSINDLMCVLLESSTITDFNPQRAIQLWLKSGIRRKRPEMCDSHASSYPVPIWKKQEDEDLFEDELEEEEGEESDSEFLSDHLLVGLPACHDDFPCEELDRDA